MFKEVKPSHSSLEQYGIKNAKALWNLSPEDLTKITVENNLGEIADSGALSIDTGEFKGRSPLDRFIVKDSITADSVWWSNINIPFEPNHYDALKTKVMDHLSGQELYVRDVYACADERYRMKIRVITELPWSNLFASNMFIEPSDAERENFEPEWIVFNAPRFQAEAEKDHTRQHNFAILNFSDKVALVGGTGYTGEIKKGIFSALNFILPHQKNVLSMHCSANVGNDGDTALFFGLSGTGKTTLSADPNRRLIGDDEHGWTSDDVIFNFEGGCYAKVIDLSEEKEPDIFHAIKPGALLENIIFKPGTKNVDFEDSSKTEKVLPSQWLLSPLVLAPLLCLYTRQNMLIC